MKTLTKTLLAFAFLLLFFSNTKAQDDANCGVYIDGVKVNQIECYSFGSLTVVFPYNPAYKNFTNVKITISVITYGTTKEITSAGLFKYIKGNYMVYEILSKDEQATKGESMEAPGTDIEGKFVVRRSTMMYYSNSSDLDKPTIDILVEGQKINGYTERYDPLTKRLVEEPKYNAEELYNLRVPLINRQKLKRGDPIYTKEVDLSQPCSVSGTKVDVNNLGSSSSNSTSNNTTAEVKTTTTKTETKTNTVTKTNTPTNASNATGVKPLDKTKPGYFVEKNGSIITREGYKKGGTLNGEVRDYNDDGKIRSIYTYVNDEKTGYSATYYDNGKIELTGNYKNGEKDGEWKEYDPDGKLLNTKKYLNGEVQD